MKKIITVLLSCLLGFSCANDFNELSDTNHRSIGFKIDVATFFDQVLIRNGSDFKLGCEPMLEDGMAFRISLYCFSADGEFVRQAQCLYDKIETVEITMKHLQKDNQYEFIILADIVKRDQYIDYYETWFHVNSTDIDMIHVYASQKNSSVHNNILMIHRLMMSPENQVLNITMEPFSRNSYFVLRNTAGIEEINGSLGYSDASTLGPNPESDMIRHDFAVSTPTANDITIPLYLLPADDSVILNLNVTDNGQTLTKGWEITNTRGCSFVVFIDCSKMTIDDYLVF